MRNLLVFAFAIASGMGISSASGAVPAGPSTAKTPASSTSLPVTVGFCQSSLQHSIAYRTKPSDQMVIDLDTAGFKGDVRDAQAFVCAVYYRGLLDGIELSAPRT